MNILLIGHKGFIGKNLKDYLEKRGHLVIPFEGDIINFSDCIVNFQNKFDALINLAAYGNNSAHLKGLAGDNRTIDTNLIGTINLIKLFLISNAKTFIIAGSSSEYGSINKPLSVDTLPIKDGQTMYSVTKKTISELFKGLDGISHKNFKVLRLFTVYGKGEADNHLIPTILRSIKEGSTMPLASGSHDFVYIEDVCRAFERLLTGISPTISHAATGKQYTNLQVVKTIEKITKKKLLFYKSPQMYKYDRRIWVSDPKSILVKPKYDLEKGLKKWLKLSN